MAKFYAKRVSVLNCETKSEIDAIAWTSIEE